jgi:hypothetical protein
MILSCQLKTCIKFHNKKTDSSQAYGIAQNYRLLHKVIHCFAQHDLRFEPLPFSEALSKRIIFQIKLIGIAMIFYCIKLIFLECNSSWVVSRKYNVNVNIQPPAMLVFSVFHKTVFMKSCSSFQVLSAFEISWSHIDWCNFRIHVRSFKISPLPYLKTPLVEIMIQMKLVGMSMIFRFAKLYLSNCSGLRVVSVKQNVNF